MEKFYVIRPTKIGGQGDYSIWRIQTFKKISLFLRPNKNLFVVANLSLQNIEGLLISSIDIVGINDLPFPTEDSEKFFLCSCKECVEREIIIFKTEIPEFFNALDKYLWLGKYNERTLQRLRWLKGLQ